MTHLSLVMLALLACGPEGASKLADSGESDGGAAPGPLDSDGDGILDIHEGTEDPDGDGLGNHLDTDSDGDGVQDELEAGDTLLETPPVDSDKDGVPDFLDLDSDDNCVPDNVEGPAGGALLDTDLDGVPDLRDPDDDGDGLSDRDEGLPLESCGDYDFDGDGLPDRLDADSDADGIEDRYEGGQYGRRVDTDGDGSPDFRDFDADGDGLPDADEGAGDGRAVDTDGDGRYDHEDRDADGDGIEDDWEINVYLTDPRVADSDGDGVPDGGEVYAGTDPLDSSSIPRGIYVETTPRTAQELEHEVAITIQKADVAFLLDTTATMMDEASALAASFNDITTRLALNIPDMAFGFAQYEDYWMVSTGTSTTGALPYRLRQQITTSISRMNTALSTVEHHAGGIGRDYPESGFEGLYQLMAGFGYDTDCDSVYDPEKDVRPFYATVTDPFGALGGQNYDPTVPGTGTLGGIGFREKALPIIIYATDDAIKDADQRELYEFPNGCPLEAGMTDVIRAADALGAYLIGICSPGLNECKPAMEELAYATNSLGDTDSDGVNDDPMVLTWNTSRDETTDLIAGSIETLVEGIQFDRMDLELDDPRGYVVDLSPRTFDLTSLEPGTTHLSFTIELLGIEARDESDQYYMIRIDAIGDGRVYVDEVTILVRVLPS